VVHSEDICKPRNLGARATSTGRVNSIRRNNTELCEVRIELERRLAHLVAEERQVLMLVLNEYLYCSVRTLKGCCRALPKGRMRLGQGRPIYQEDSVRSTVCVTRGDEESVG